MSSSKRADRCDQSGSSGATQSAQAKSVRAKSQIPHYVAPRHRRHSDTQSRASDECCTSRHSHYCSVHGNRSPNDMLLYEMLQNMDLSPDQCQIPEPIRALHKNHVCSNVGKSRSVPTSKFTSVVTSPLSTPSTPTDSRRMSLNRNSLSNASTPLRQSSLSVNSQLGRNPPKTFAQYMPLCEVQRGLQKGEIVEGVLRINPRNYTDAYISAPEGGLDIYVGGMTDRNRAFNGDRVAVKLNDVRDWKVLFDVIRIHWDEWRHYFQPIIDRNQSSNNYRNPIACSQSSAQTVTIPINESDESCDAISRQSEAADPLVDLLNDSRSDIKMKNNHEISEAIDGSKAAKNAVKRKRKRSRKKKKPISETCEDRMNECTEDCDKISNSQNELLKNSEFSDDLNLKVKQIQGIPVELLRELPFFDRCVQKTGHVVRILEEIHPRIAGGRLSHMREKNPNWALFLPNDSRFPRMRIAMNSCPDQFFNHPQHFAQSLFIAKLEEWKTDDTFPRGRLEKHLGNAGDIEAESELILLENKVNFDDFPPNAYYGLPHFTEDQWPDDHIWSIPDFELKTRRDFRDECVFTIDPSTARDLDDALSVKEVDRDLWQIGVHIADVSYFLKEEMPLDAIARERATSVYLVQKVIPMLPKVLCEKLCSLNPGEEKLTFSVVWTINSEGQIVDQWFGRTMIKSCIKLSYELAQEMIDEPTREWRDYELPQIHGRWTHRDISESVNIMNRVAVRLRKDRFERGALKIEKLKLSFVLDKETGLPSGYSPYLYRDSNRLVEEFMLLANMAVAHKIYDCFTDKAFLRCHPPPSEDGLKDFNSFCRHNGFQVDTSSSLSLQKSLDALVSNDPNIWRVVAHYLLKAMQPAQYVCVGMQSAAQGLRHYALSVPLYTHFTSPIRRYPDVIVHRLLAASLGYRPMISESVRDLHRIAQNCNDKKLSARFVSESSSRLFLNIFIKQIGKIDTTAIVVQVYDHSFDVMILNCGLIARVYLDPLPLKQFVFETKHGKNQLILHWNDLTPDACSQSQPRSSQLIQVINACLVLRVQVSISDEDSSKVTALLQHPNGNFYNNSKRNGLTRV